MPHNRVFPNLSGAEWSCITHKATLRWLCLGVVGSVGINRAYAQAPDDHGERHDRYQHHRGSTASTELENRKPSSGSMFMKVGNPTYSRYTV